MNNPVDSMRGALNAIIPAAELGGDLALEWDDGGMFFILGSSSVEVAYESGTAGGHWRVRSVSEVADVVEGGMAQVASTLTVHPAEDVVHAAKAALLAVVAFRIDAAIDSII